MKNNYLKESILIICVTIIISLVYNSLSQNGIPLIRKPIQFKWESDSTLENIIKSNNTSDFSNVTKDFNNKLSEIKENIQISKNKESKDLVITKDTISKLKSNKSDIDSKKNNDISEQSNNEDVNNVPVAITVDQAYKIFLSGRGVFIDARMEIEYNLGHIKGAINIPLKKFEENLAKLKTYDKNTIFVCYCDGSGCDLSIDLAKKLHENGFKNVKIFYSGWNDWKEKNYPME
ncbi:MAG TPA: rhodanese-like domain-containing protein [Bacteroidota bacterium]|nr:rhodanese-like domain-containing protein [Bacteroidota bacterium]